MRNNCEEDKRKMGGGAVLVGGCSTGEALRPEKA